MIGRFECAAGSIPGRDHVGDGRLLVGRNNQDAWEVRASGDFTLAVVCDGCSAGRRAECGAALGARWLLEALARRLPANEPWAVRLETARREVLARLGGLLDTLGGERAQSLHDFLLFTALGAIVTPHETAIFAIGDGVFAVNGEWTRLGPYPENAPPYLAYGLCGTDGPVFQIQRVLPTAELDSILLGTDGVEDLIRVADRSIPGTKEPVGPIEQFWRDDRFFHNPDALRRRLARISSAAAGPVRIPGLLRDDTTLVVIRRRRTS